MRIFIRMFPYISTFSSFAKVLISVFLFSSFFASIETFKIVVVVPTRKKVHKKCKNQINGFARLFALSTIHLITISSEFEVDLNLTQFVLIRCRINGCTILCPDRLKLCQTIQNHIEIIKLSVRRSRTNKRRKKEAKKKRKKANRRQKLSFELKKKSQSFNLLLILCKNRCAN